MKDLSAVSTHLQKHGVASPFGGRHQGRDLPFGTEAWQCCASGSKMSAEAICILERSSSEVGFKSTRDL